MKVQFFSQVNHRLIPTFVFFMALFLTGCLSAGVENRGERKARDPEQSSEEEHELKSEDKAEGEGEDLPDFIVYPPLDERDAVAFLTDYGKRVVISEVKLNTPYGEITVRLYDDTPLHRANFLYLIERRYYNPTTIVRVVPDFVIQGGNSEELEDRRMRSLIGSYTLPSEFRGHHIHKRGALAMSRSYVENPGKRSSAYDFYIVLGKPLSQASLYSTSLDNQRDYTEEQKNVYLSSGGAPHLDNEHTVFGEVIRGMDVVEQISRVERDASDWPREHLEVRMEVLN